MNFTNRSVLIGLVALSISIAGCQSKSQNPSAPTASPDAGTTNAAPDGTTLKVTAPAATSPAGGEKVQSRRPTLIVANGAGRHRTLTANIQFELSDGSGVIYTSGQIAPTGTQTLHTLPNDLAYETDYRFRARAMLNDGSETLIGPWSAYSAFRSPDTPVVLGAPSLLSPVDNQILNTRTPELQVTNGSVSGPAGAVVYRFELANDAAFTAVLGAVIAPRSGGATTSASFGALPESRHIFWRVTATNGTVQSPSSAVWSFRTPDPPPPPPPPPAPTPAPPPAGGGVGPGRSIGVNEALSIIIDVHNRLGYNLGSSSTREYRIDFIYAAVAVLHYGHPTFNPAGPDSDWCVKDAGGGRPPSDDVLVRCGSRDAWDLIGGAGANGYNFHLDYLGTLPSNQNVYAPPRGSLPR